MASRDALIRKLARMAAREDDSTAHDQQFQEAARPVVPRPTSARQDVTRPAGRAARDRSARPCGRPSARRCPAYQA